MNIATDHACRNCGATTSGNFCHMCGQETRLHAPSFSEFMHEFIGHYVALEGRLWGTITRLLFRPGLLTTEYLAGRRKRYVEPLRLYLSLSIIFFAVLKFSDADVVKVDAPPPPPSVQRQAESRQAPPAAADENFEQMLKRNAPSIFNPIDRFDKMSNEGKNALMQAAFYKYAPYAIFLLMPIFALWLKVLYARTGKKYGEHLLFALHTNAFAFFMLGVFIFLPEGFLKFAAFCWVLGYLPWAMQRVYQKGRWGTFWRWLLLAVLHGMSLVIAIIGVMGLGIMNAH